MRPNELLLGRGRRARRKIRHCVLLLLLLSFTPPLYAQVGNNNPSGVSGIFNGEIADGVDPYTGNVTRSITDIAVAGAVGDYPLALVRTYNSRTPVSWYYGIPFGWGGWTHNYNWILEDSPLSGTPNFAPTHYTVDFPDGRSETFRAVTWDTAGYYRVRPGADTPAQSTSAGVRDRFMPLSYGYCYLILPDGGKIKFHAQQHSAGGLYYYKYTATAIIDPHGLSTSLTWDTSTWPRLTRVTEPAGRYLQFYYNGQNSLLISQVTEVIGGVSRRNVNYYYSPDWQGHLYLDHVVYYNNSNWTARYQWQGPNTQNSGIQLLSTCDDPMYAGPMKRISYQYATNHDAGTCAWAVYGQIWRERYWDGVIGHESNGPTICELSACTNGSSNGPNYRMETRGDGRTRGFTYSTDGYLQSRTDFMNHTAWQGYDAKKYINSVTDARGQSAGDPSHTTNYVNDPITGNVTQIQFPLTPGDTPDQGNSRPTVNYTYTNNYYLHTVQDEGGHITTINRDGNNRVTEVDYPDGGYEQFFSYNSFNQFQTHRMITGGNEAFTYDGRGLTQTYRNPDTVSGNPTARYLYDAYDRVSDVTDVLGTSLGDPNHTTSYAYNLRGQVTSITSPVVDGSRHTLAINSYNPDGTLQNTTDALGHVTSYTYDDYRRVESVIKPERGDNTGTHTTSFYYDANGTADDYTFTDSNVRWMILPSGKKTYSTYDNNRRKSTVIAGYGTPFAATTSYGYDNVGNVTSVVAPNQQNTNQSTQMAYDERNRPSSITDALNRTTSFTYDTGGRKKTITRPNNQVITNVNFDEMNRVTQQTATNAGTTKYTYYPGSGLLETMQDPHLVAINSTDAYSYAYDTMGRKHIVTHPAEPNTGIRRTEVFNYDAAGHLYQYTTRGSKTQTFAYDALNRMTGFSWNDGSTPSVHFDCDVASRLIGITNRQPNNGSVIATISRGYFNDNLLRSETETITGGVARQVSYTYDADGNRATLSIPGYSFTYDYTSRNQVKTITDNGSNITSSFWYDKNGNVVQRNPGNGTTSSYTPDALDRITQIVHSLNGTTRTFNYGYYANSDDRKWTQRLGTVQGNVGDVFSYDYNDQVTAVQLNIANPNTADPGNPSITYDGNGNRIWYAPPGVNKHYDGLSNLSEYTHVVINSSQYNLTYGGAANLTQYDRNNSSYNYDAQNRLTSATVSGVTINFQYDGLNRQVSRQMGNGTTYYSTWDGWNLVEDYHGNGVADATYLYGPTGLVKNLRTNNYYYQDGSGSTALVASNNGTLREWYRYDLDGTPLFYNPNDTQRNPNQSGYGVRHLFTGQQWYGDVGLYDLRNRFYSPDIGRFLQPDPIGFRGGNNLYRYCGNNPVMRRDPSGLQDQPIKQEGQVPTVTVTATWFEDGWYTPPGIAFRDPSLSLRPLSPYYGYGPLVGNRELGYRQTYIPFARPLEDDQPTQQSAPPPQNPPPPAIDPSHPATTAEFIAAGNMIEHGNTMDTTPAIDPISLASGAFAARTLLTVAARATTAELSVIRYTRAGETFIRYESGNPAFSRLTASGGVTPGTYAAPVSNGVVPLELRASTYNLPSPDILRSNAIILRPPTGTPVIGPRSVFGGTGDEVIFPFGY